MTRISPTVQQAGTQTIQQSIYLVHKNPCGLNPILSTKMGTTGLTYQTFSDLLTMALNNLDVIAALENVQQNFLLYMENSTSTNDKLRFLNSLFQYGKTIWETGFENGDLIQIEGYTPVLTCYDGNGTTFFDSSIQPYWNPAKEIGPDLFEYTKVVLLTPNPSNTDKCVFYELLSKPTCYPFIRSDVSNQAQLINSSYLVNQISLAESIMAINSLLTDPANTRVYNAFRFGFATRVDSPGNGNPAYHVCYLQLLKNQPSISSNTFFQNLSDMFFVRLSLIRN